MDEMLEGAYTIDKEILNEVQASSEMTSFITAMKLPLSTKTGGTVPEMSDDISVEIMLQ